MRGIPLFLLLLLECCKTSSAPAPQRTADQVAAELIDAGCLAPGPGVTDAVAAEQATGHDSWLGCLFDGGTIPGCNAPCERGGFVRRPAVDQ